MMTTINKTTKISKKASKGIAVVLACAMTTAMFVGCGSATTNEAPEIVGAGDFDCVINEPVDLLRRVAALDKEDGDLTPKMNISISPAAQLNDGVAVFTKTGDYKITYSVTDSDNNTATAEGYVSVISRSVHTAFDLIDMNGFSLEVGGSAKLDSQKVAGDGDQSNLLFKATGAASAADVALTRTYALKVDHEHTFKYTVKSNVAGTAWVSVDGVSTELAVAEGDNELTFTCNLSNIQAPEGKETVDIKVQLLLGGLGDNIEMEFVKAEVSYEGEIDSKVTFTSSNVFDRLDGASGSAGASEDKSSATLKITSAADADWKGGMFINTGNKLMAGVEYTVSFDVNAANANKYAVIIQNRQWDEVKYDTVTVEQEGSVHKEVTFAPTAENIANKDELWLYVMSGDQVNEITISNIEVTRGEIPHTTYDVEFVKSIYSPEETTDVTFTKDTNVFDRFDGAEGAVETAEDNSSVTLKITSTADADWRGGMFIKTECPLVADAEYKVFFDVVATNADKFAVKLQNKQWGEQEYAFINVEGATESAHQEATFTPSADKVNSGEGLWLYVMSGDHENEITLSNLKVVKSESSQSGNVIDRFDEVGGTVEVAEDKSSATLKITSAGDADWRGGMFIDTGCTLVAGVEYKVSFDVVATGADKFAVLVRSMQWGGEESQYEFINVENATSSTHKESTFTPTAEYIAESDGLWLYVQSGDKLNEITLSNLKVEVLGESGNDSDKVTISETFRCHNIYKMFAYAGATNYAEWDNGKLVFRIEKFGIVDENDPTKFEIKDWHHKIEGPVFDMGTGSFGDYYISFKARATAPLKMVVVGPKDGGWDPNLIWAEINLTDVDTMYTIKSNAMAEPVLHHFEWQFGWAANMQYENVVIEISDIMICYKSAID